MRSQPKKKVHKKGGGLIAAVNRTVKRFYRFAENGVFGRFFTSYDKAQEKLERSKLSALIEASKAKAVGKKSEPIAETLPEEAVGVRSYESESVHRGIRARFAEKFEHSKLVGGARMLKSAFLNTPLVTYGLLLFGFALFLLLSEALIMAFDAFKVPLGVFSYVTDADIVLTITYMAVAVVLMVLSLILIFAQEGSLYDFMLDSAIFGAFLHGTMGISRQTAERKGSCIIKRKYAFLIGMLFGILTFFITPYRFFVTALVILLLAVTLNMPEFGLVVGIFFLPYLSLFSHPIATSVFASLTVTISTLLKIIRGKRTYRLELLDLFVGFFFLAILFGGIVTVGGISSTASSLICLSLGLVYFPTVVLVRDKASLRRILDAIMLSSLPIVLLVIFEFVLGKASPIWQGFSIFEKICGFASSLWGTHGVLAQYLLVAFFITFGLLVSSSKRHKKFFLFIMLFLQAAALLFTGARGALIAFAAAFLVTLLVYSHKNLPFVILLIALSVVTGFFLPESVSAFLAEFFAFSDPSKAYRLSLWKGCASLIRQCFLTGVGFGSAAFEQAYGSHALVGAEEAAHAHNLLMEITVELGVVGLLLFMALMIVTLRVLFTLFAKCRMQNIVSLMSLGIFSALTALLANGVTDYIWHNSRIFLLFFLLIGLIRTSRKIGEGSMPIVMQDADAVDLDYILRH